MLVGVVVVLVVLLVLVELEPDASETVMGYTMSVVLPPASVTFTSTV